MPESVREYLDHVRGLSKGATFRTLMERPHYELLLDEDGHSAIRCAKCLRVSYLAQDIREHYCGFCHCFLDDILN
jgi:hypothetical protein